MTHQTEQLVMKMIAVNPDYPNLELRFHVYYKPSGCDIGFFTDLEPIIAQKKCTVVARKAVEGERVITAPMARYEGRIYRLKEGEVVITKKMADAGAMIITNPYGEIYFNQSKEDFERKYGKVKNNGKPASYEIQGKPQKFYSVTENVVLFQPWGENGDFVCQFIPRGSMLNVTDRTEPYGVTNIAFESTYELLK